MFERFTLSRPARLCAVSAGFASLFAAALLWNPASTVRAASGQESAASPEFYTQKVQPILQANCYRCHGGMNHRGGLKVDTPEGLLAGGKHGHDVVPGHPEQSLLISLIRHEGPVDDPMPMPPKGKLSDADIATVTEWIKSGAVMPKAQ